MSFTTPLVRFPDRWSFFNTIKTSNPGLIFTRFVPFIIFLSYDKNQKQSNQTGQTLTKLMSCLVNIYIPGQYKS